MRTTSSFFSLAPLLRVALCLLAGIILARFVFPNASQLFIILLFAASALAALIAIFTLRRHSAVSSVLCLMPFIFLGWMAHLLHTPSSPLPWPDQPEAWRGIVTEVGRSEKNARCFLTLTAMEKDSVWTSEQRNIVFYTPVADTPSIHVGDAILFKSKIYEVGKNNIPGSEGYNQWLKYKEIEGRTFVHRWQQLPSHIAQADMEHLPLTERLRLKALKVRTSLSRHYESLSLPTDATAILQSITLGDKSQLRPALKIVYSQTGCAHVLALSGLHLGILTGFLLLILYKVRHNRAWAVTCTLFTLCLVWAFAWITGLSISLQRAAWMTTLWLLCLLRQRSEDMFNSLGFAACMLLIADPMCIVDVGFRLSFISVMAILLATPLFIEKTRKLPQPLNWISNVLLVSFSAQLATMPLIAYHFGFIPTYGIPTSLISIPCAYLLLGGGWIYLLSCSIGLPMTFFGTATGSVASAMNSALTAVARLPFASISIPTLEWWHIAGLYVWLILFVAVLRRPGYRLMQGLLAMTALLVIGFTLTFC